MTRLDHRWLIGGIVLWTMLVIPPVRTWMEGIMVLHVLQLALLACVGMLLARGLGCARYDRIAMFNHYGITGTVLALIVLTFWLLPVSLDRSLDDCRWEVAKFVSLPLLLGLPLASSWPCLPPLVRGALWANAIPMAAVMGWLYREAPLRLCNNYLRNDQEMLGLGWWGLATLIAGYWTVRALVGWRPPHMSQ